MIENSTSGLTLLDPDHTVVVTQEEHHQDALRVWAPRGDGRARRVAVELCPAPLAHGSHRGRPGIEIRLDGKRVGELTARMSERYGPLVQQVLRAGGRPGCVALVRYGKRGIEVELRLPEVPVGAPVPAGSVPDAPASRGRRTPLLIGAGVTTLLLVIMAALSGTGDSTVTASTGTAAAVGSEARSTTTAPVTTTAAGTTTPAPVTTSPAPVVADVAAAGVPAARQTTTRATTRTAPRTTTPLPAPAPAPEPKPAPKPEPAPAASSGCDPNYSGCVPIASDVDCEGGSGDGPKYVRGPVRVIGSDIYGLDGNDNDGIGCE